MVDTAFNVIDYRGLNILTPNPIGDGGELINDNFRYIADRLNALEFSIIGDEARTISALTDVTIIPPVDDNEVLAFNASTGRWMNKTPEDAGIAPLHHTHTASDISDFAEAVANTPAVLANTAHVSSTDNPHNVTALQVGSNIAQWNADRLAGRRISDVAPLDGQVLKWDAAQNRWQPAQDLTSGGAILSELLDVTISSPINNNLLAYDTSIGMWMNKTASQAGLAPLNHSHTLGSLSDVTLTASISQGEIIAWDGVNRWRNSTPSDAGIAPLHHTHVVADITDLNEALGDLPILSDMSAHLSDLNNPHQVTAEQVGNEVAQWNAALLRGREISEDEPTDGYYLRWNSSENSWMASPIVSISDINDVAIDNDEDSDEHVVNNHVLMYEDGMWVNKPLTYVYPELDELGVLVNHIHDHDNPHNVTAEQVGNDIDQWNADRLRGLHVEESYPLEGYVLKFIGGMWRPAPEAILEDSDGLVINLSLGELLDVNIDGPVAGQVLAYDGQSGLWTNINIYDDQEFTLGNLHDVNIESGLSNNDVLFYNSESSRWEAGQFEVSLSIDDLLDVDITELNNGDILRYNSFSDRWVNVPLGDLDFVSVTGDTMTGDLIIDADLQVDGVVRLGELSTSLPVAEAGMGKIFVKDDNHLYYLNSTGVETRLDTATNSMDHARLSQYLLIATTNDTTPSSELLIDGVSRFEIDINTALSFDIVITAYGTNGEASSWRITGLIKNNTGIADIANYNVDVIFNDTLGQSLEWSVDVVSSDNTVRFNVFGEGEVRWSAKLSTAEVIL